jgi:hypothetical protein
MDKPDIQKLAMAMLQEKAPFLNRVQRRKWFRKNKKELTVTVVPKNKEAK